MTGMTEVLTQLKREAKLKEYHARPEGSVVVGDFTLTYCLERTVLGIRPTLAISRSDRGRVALPSDFVDAVRHVFGRHDYAALQVYPKRGETMLLVWTKAPAQDQPR